MSKMKNTVTGAHAACDAYRKKAFWETYIRKGTRNYDFDY